MPKRISEHEADTLARRVTTIRSEILEAVNQTAKDRRPATDRELHAKPDREELRRRANEYAKALVATPIPRTPWKAF